jgi:predicted phosphoadenosine phosphosulfate sulfurtransferase
VAFSGGKDSTVVLNLALEQARARGKVLDAFFWDEEAIQPETVAYVESVYRLPDVRLRWLCWPVEHRNACSRKSPYWWPWAPEARSVWVREPPAWANLACPEAQLRDRKPIKDLNGYLFPESDLRTVAIVFGIRAQESIRRQASVSMRVEDNWLSPDRTIGGRITLAKPIYDWSTEDVWTAPHMLGWPYNTAYDVMTAAGISRKQQRICQPFGEEPLEGLHLWQTCWPETWERLLVRVPGASTAARYNRTELYSYGRIASPPDGDWRGAIERAIALWGPEQQEQIRASLAALERVHWAKTSDPIPEREHHPVSGLSLSEMLSIAIRGDLKGRRAFRAAELARASANKRSKRNDKE